MVSTKWSLQSAKGGIELKVDERYFAFTPRTPHSVLVDSGLMYTLHSEIRTLDFTCNPGLDLHTVIPNSGFQVYHILGLQLQKSKPAFPNTRLRGGGMIALSKPNTRLWSYCLTIILQEQGYKLVDRIYMSEKGSGSYHNPDEH